MRSQWIVAAAVALTVVFCATWVCAQPEPNQDEVKKMTAAMPAKTTVKSSKVHKILVFSLTKGFAHDSIPLCAKTFEVMGKTTGAWETTKSLDPAIFAPDKIKEFDAVIMNNTTGDLTGDAALKAGLIDFVKGGKGIMGVHAATDCWYNFKDYGDMMGGFFAGHPFSRISVKLDDPKSPINAAFKDKGFEITDEIYTFKDPYSRDKLHILVSIDWANAGNLRGGTRPQDNDYALGWIHEYGKGRVFYSAFGHQHQIFWNTAILQHWLDGIQYILGDLKADATPSAKLSPAPEAAPGPNLGGAAPAKKADAAPARSDVAVYAAPAAKPADGWITLFDGKDTSAWQEPAVSKWTVADGVLSTPGNKGDIWTKEQFGDFTVDLEFRCARGTNSGVFLRSPKGEQNWLEGSIEIQILDSYGPARKPGKNDCGSIYDCLAPSVAAEKPVGEWNHMVITAKGNSIKITLNDKDIIDTNLDKWTQAGKNPDGTPNKFHTAYKDMAKVGNLGLQDHGAPVWFRNIKIKKLDEAK